MMSLSSPSLLGLKKLSVQLVDCLKTPAVLRPEARATRPGNFRHLRWNRSIKFYLRLVAMVIYASSAALSRYSGVFSFLFFLFSYIGFPTCCTHVQSGNTLPQLAFSADSPDRGPTTANQKPGENVTSCDD